MPTLNAQHYLANIQHYDITQGISHREVFAIHEDEQGFIWLGTKYGLNRFDGKEFKWFTKEKNGLAANTIHYIKADGMGNLWLFETVSWFYLEDIKSVSILNLKTEKITVLDENNFPVPWSSMKNILPNPKGGFYIGTTNGQLLKYHGETGFSSIPTPQIQTFIPFVWSPKHTIWGLTENRHIAEIDTLGQIVQIFQSSRFQNYQRLELLHQDEQGRIWFATLKELLVQVETQKEIFAIDDKSELTMEEAVPQMTFNTRDAFTKVFIDKKKELFWHKGNPQLWVTNGQNEIVYDFLEKHPDIAKSDIRTIYFDKANRAWIGTFYGLYLVDLYQSPFQKYLYLAPEQNQTNDFFSCRSILDKKDTVWINTYQGLHFFDKQKKTTGVVPRFQYLDPIEQVEHTYFVFSHALMDDKDGTLWVGDKGIARLDKKEAMPTIFPYALSMFKDRRPGMIWSLAKDANGKIWVGTEQGLGYLDTLTNDIKLFEPDPVHQDLQNAQINALVKSPDGFIFLGTNKGLFQLKPETGELQRFWTEGTDSHYLPSSDIRHLHFDKQGIMWLASYGSGLIRVIRKPEKFAIQSFTIADGLSNNNLYAVYEDKNDNLWISSDFGIIQFNKTTHQSKAFLPKDGTSHHEFNTTSHHQATDGKIYFGSLNGVTAFYPDEVLKNQESFDVPLVITQCQQFDKAANKIIDKRLEVVQTKTIQLRPNEVFFDLKFALLHYQNPDQIRYAYQLTEKGQQEDNWTFIKDGAIRFSGLPYGDYQLFIKGQGPDGRFSTQEIELSIHVLKPIYLQTWFMVLSILLFLGSIYFYYKKRTRDLKWQQQRLQQMVEERTQIIQQQNEQLKKDKLTIGQQTAELRQLDTMKSRFFANVSHELRTPLTLMLAPIANTLQENKLTNRAYTNLLLAQRNGQRINKMINEILDLNKLEAGKLDVHFHKTVWYNFLKSIIASFESLANQKQINFHFEYQGNKYLQVLIDQKKTEIILFNLMSNAFKFTPNRGKVEMIATDGGAYLEISIADTGRGIHPVDLPHIFNRFYQTKQKNSAAEGGTGIGLALSKAFIQLLGGTIKVVSQLQKGTTFIVQIPKKEVIAQITTEEASSISFKEDNFQHKHILEQPALQTNHNMPSEKATILLVEDNRDLRLFISSLLEEQYQMISAENGQMGWEKLGKQQPHLIISDIMMPIMDGYQLVEKVKSDEQLRQIPIIILTARAGLDDKIKALRIGVDDYLTKPFVAEELFARIENLLKNAQNRQLALTEIPSMPEEEAAKEPAQAQSMSELKTITPELQSWLQELETKVLENIEDTSYTLDRLAFEMAISKRQLARRIKKLVGVSPREYLKTIRYTKARSLLENQTYQTVKAVAYSVGLKDVVHFSRQFRDRFGKFPSEYL